MRWLVPLTLAVALQLLLGALTFTAVSRLLVGRGARRRWIVAWGFSARALRRLGPWAALAVVGSLLATRASASGLSGALPWVRPVGFSLVGAVPTSASAVALWAAVEEARGRWRRARHVVRLAGELGLVGSVALLVLVWEALLFHAPLRRALVAGTEPSGLMLLFAMVALGVGSFVGVTGGLAGKPRPSAYFMAALYFIGLASLVAAYQLARVQL